MTTQVRLASPKASRLNVLSNLHVVSSLEGVTTPAGLIPTGIPLYHFLLSPPLGHSLRRSEDQAAGSSQQG